MNDDYIRRKDAIAPFAERERIADERAFRGEATVQDAQIAGMSHSAVKILAAIPAADVRPVVRGEWGWSNVDGRCVLACSKCGSIMPTDHAMDYIDAEDNRFCYWCGADMRPEGGADG